MSEAASGTISATQLDVNSYQYTITLQDTGTTNIGTFWFGWIPGQDYLDTRPTAVTNPAGWTDAITHAGVSDGYAIQWKVKSTATGEIAPGGSLSFTFTSADAPAQMFGDSNFYPGTPVLTAFVYSGLPFSDPGFEFTLTAACFHAGTRILTARGEVAVEQLQIGDRLVTPRDGGAAPVQWLGHRRVDCRRHPKPEDVWPVRVRRDAFAPGAPCRDLLLSPDHAVFAAGALIPVRYLLNGATVAQEAAEWAEYWHVELPAHDVILAEMLPAESYLDTGNRAAFANGGAAMQLHPDFALKIWDAKACAPLATGGGALAAVRASLLERAIGLGYAVSGDPRVQVVADGHALPGECDGPIWRFRMPDGVQTVRLVSRIWSPAHLLANTADLRPLGVAVSQLWLDGREMALDSATLGAGWHAPEAGWRWTDGNAEIAVADAAELTFAVAINGQYWVREMRGAALAA